ncbi:MAG: oligosaccharide flippase family protein [Solirubrobacterales bacterium]
MSDPSPNPSVEAPLATAEREVRGSMGGRFNFEGGLREHTARGVIINAAFQAGFAGLGLLQRFAAAAFLTTAEFGVWGLVLTTLITLSFLKQIGISDKYIQQEEDDQELAFQRAFSLELVYTSIFCAAILVVLPLYALLYGEPEVLLPSMVLTLALLGSALNAPLWIPLRRMQFVRQRLLEAINPVVSTIVIIALAIAGAGYWALVVGLLAGVYAAALAAWITCPYKLAFHFDRETLGDYVRFSWPLLLAGGSGLIVVQGTMIVANYSVGLAGVGAITLAGSLIVFAQRVDTIISRTIYPAICAVKDQTELLFETFVKSNRLALMWGLPFGVGLALFASDLVDLVLGDRWDEAVLLLQGLGVLVGLRQLGFNWSLFFQATGETRPMAVSGVAALVAFVVGIAPAILLFGLPGYVIGMGIALAVDLAVRAHYLNRLFVGFSPIAHTLRAFTPTLPAVAAVFVARAIGPSERTLALSIGELVLYCMVTVGATMVLERKLLREILSYLRPKPGVGGAIPPHLASAGAPHTTGSPRR